MSFEIIDDMRTMDAVYWELNKNAAGQIIPDNSGQPTFKAGVNVKVWWKDSVEVFADPNGVVRNSKSIVFVGQDMDWKGFLWLGTVATLPAGTSTAPRKVFRAAEIMRFDKIPAAISPGPDTKFVRKAYL